MFTEGFSKFLIGLGTGVLLLGFIIFCYKDALFQFDSQIKSDKIGQLGDFIGGIVGSIWALAGVILFYVALQSQKAALDDQKRSTQAAIEAVQSQNESIKLQIKEIALQREEMSKSTAAQNQSQIALNNQLRNMQLTSQIDILNQYIDLMDSKGKSDHIKASKEIIHQLTNQIFYNPEYLEFVKPTFTFKSIHIGQSELEGEQFNYIIYLKCNMECDGIKLKTSSAVNDLQYRKVNQVRKKYIEIRFIAEKNVMEFEITYLGTILPNRYKQILTINNDEASISEQEIIENTLEL